MTDPDDTFDVMNYVYDTVDPNAALPGLGFQMLYSEGPNRNSVWTLELPHYGVHVRVYRGFPLLDCVFSVRDKKKAFSLEDMIAGIRVNRLRKLLREHTA